MPKDRKDPLKHAKRAKPATTEVRLEASAQGSTSAVVAVVERRQYTDEEEAKLRKKKEIVLWQADPDDEECGRHPCFCGCECDAGLNEDSDDA
jgi:hypothetical protein